MREEFIKRFVLEMIGSSYKPSMPLPNLNVEVKPIEEVHEMIPSMIHEMEEHRIPQPNFQPPPYVPQLRQPNPAQTPQTSLGKINTILNDPSVFAVECQGAGKNVLVNRGGKILVSQTILSEDEIKEVLGDFSQKTRIPLQQGVFRTLYQDLLITAIISEFVGTRFVIQKKTPFQAV